MTLLIEEPWRLYDDRWPVRGKLRSPYIAAPVVWEPVTTLHPLHAANARALLVDYAPLIREALALTVGVNDPAPPMSLPVTDWINRMPLACALWSYVFDDAWDRAHANDLLQSPE